jgi:hypothetical protein
MFDREGSGWGVIKPSIPHGPVSDSGGLSTVDRWVRRASLVTSWIVYALACVGLATVSTPMVIEPIQPTWWRDYARSGIIAVEQYLARSISSD